MSGTVCVIAVRSSAKAIGDSVFVPKCVVARHPCLYPLPPACSHLMSGSTKMMKSSGERVSPWMVPLPIWMAGPAAALDADVGCCPIVDALYCIHCILCEPQVIHGAQQLVMVYHVEG